MATSAPTTSVAEPLRPETAHRWFFLSLSLAALLLSLVLSVDSDQRQVVLPLIGQPLPPLCQMQRFFGLDCPGCGLTRSFIALAHGDLGAALRFNAAGPLWFAFIAAQVPWQALQLGRIARGRQALDLGWWGHGLMYAGIAALILQWVVRQLAWI